MLQVKSPKQSPVQQFSTALLQELAAYLPSDERPSVTLSDLKIRTKKKTLVTLQPNEVQTLYLDMLAKEHEAFRWRAGEFTLRGVREDILKARQEGMSTLWLALYFMDTINTPLTQSIIIAHDADSTEKLFQIVKRYYDGLPVEKQRPLRYSNRREIHFEDIDSAIYVGTAGAKRVGRGGTINNVHMSERAFWENGDVVETGLLEAVPFDGNVTRETTANGLNEYYEEYQRSKRGESRFRARFFGWNILSEYRIGFGMGGVPRQPESGSIRGGDAEHGTGPDGRGNWTAEERSLASVYGLDDSQLRWRREKLRDLKDKFQQEYPINDIEAFLASGNPRFNRAYLYDVVLPRLQRPDYAPDRVETPSDRGERKSGAWHGTVTTYVEPERSHRYMIVVDTAKGLTEGGKADYSVTHVYDLHTYEQVCHYRGQMGEHDYAEDLNILGRLYNNALMVVETPGPGETVLGFLIHTIRYPAVYYYDDMLDQEGNPKTVPGYPMNTLTKPESEGYLASIIEDGARGEPTIVFRHPGTIEELIHYVKLRGAICGAESGGHDDEVTCARLFAALVPKYGLRGRPIVVASKPKRQGGYGTSSRLVKGRA